MNSARAPRRAPLLALAVTGSLALACSASGVLAEMAVDTGRKLLFDTVETNYGDSYSASLEKLVDGMITLATPPVPEPETTPEPPAAVPAEASGSVPASAPPAATSESAGPIAPAPGTPAPSTPAPLTPEPEPLVPIELEVAVFREVLVDGNPVPAPVEDGDVLRDGIGRSEAGDNIKIRIEANVECHVYGVWIDATGWATPLFPKSDAYAHVNPIQPHTEYSLPGGSTWFFLDDYRGMENLYFVASREPVPSMESSLRDLLGKRRELRSDTEPPALLDQHVEIMRGIGGTRLGAPSKLVASDGSTHEVSGQVFIAQFPESELVVSRWFRHE